jgi:hypothetical protein
MHGSRHNQALHHDRDRILVSRDTTPLQRPRRVNCCVRRGIRTWLGHLCLYRVEPPPVYLD